MQLYGEYIKERQGLELIEHTDGFVSYRIVSDECYLADIFIRKEVRKSGFGGELLGKIIKEALKAKCSVITANIYLKDPNANSTLKAAIACGFEVTSSGPDVLLIAKKIMEDL